MRAAFAALASSTLVLAVLSGPGCVIPTITQNTDAGASSSSSSSSGGDGGSGSAAAAAATGTNCTQITSTISLCQTISSCPNLTRNPKTLPQCGFRIHGAAIDPECYCQNQYLCPVGAPTTCTEAAAETTGDVNYDSVCEEAVQGRCTDLSATGGTGSGTSAACQSCVSACDNVPACIEACGC